MRFKSFDVTLPEIDAWRFSEYPRRVRVWGTLMVDDDELTERIDTMVFVDSGGFVPHYDEDVVKDALHDFLLAQEFPNG